MTTDGGTRRLLVVEDDRLIADAIARRLRSAAYEVDLVHDGPAAVEAAGRVRYDAVVLDVMLPGLDGVQVCRRIQLDRPVPVLMLTARGGEDDRLTGLDAGADDYMTKPFSPRELVARVGALLRRVDRAAVLSTQGRAGDADPAPSDQPLTVGGLEVDPRTRRVRADGTEVHLTRTEFDLVWALARRTGEVVERGRLLVEALRWPVETMAAPLPPSASRTVDSDVKALRRKLGAERIRTVHGVGYALEPR